YLTLHSPEWVQARVARQELQKRERRRERERRRKAAGYRVRLEAVDGLRARFTATVERFGSRRASRGPDQPTILLTDVRLAESGEEACGHPRLSLTKACAARAPQPGDRVASPARAENYR